jgi:hypothetical protein
MKRMWKHKWIFMGVATVIFLSVGTAAWAASGSTYEVVPGAISAGESGVLLAVNPTGTTTTDNAAALQNMRAKMKERREQFIQRQKTLYDLLRGEMSAADQAKYDQLVQQAQDQRAALEKARTDLQSTMKELRELTQQYIDSESGTTGTSTQ